MNPWNGSILFFVAKEILFQVGLSAEKEATAAASAALAAAKAAGLGPQDVGRFGGNGLLP